MSYSDGSPAVSPDGQTLAFTRGTNAWSEIYLFPLHGGESRELTSQRRIATALAWTPDGREVVYSSYPNGGTGTLWRVPVAGGEPQQLAGLGEGLWAPAIAGKRLAYGRYSSDTDIWEYSMPRVADGAPPRRAISSTRSEGEPRVSPDGNRILFNSSRSGQREVWVCDRDGSNAVQLTTFGSDAAAGSARWSPDGRQFVFDAIRDGNRDVFVMSAEGGSPRAVTEHAANDNRPSWSRDGRWIYFTSSRSGSFQVWRVPVEGGEPTQVTQGGGYQPFESPDPRFVFFGRRDGPGVWKISPDGGELPSCLTLPTPG